MIMLDKALASGAWFGRKFDIEIDEEAINTVLSRTKAGAWTEEQTIHFSGSTST